MSLVANEALVNEVVSLISGSLSTKLNVPALAKNLIMTALKHASLEAFIKASVPFGRFPASALDRIHKRVAAERDAPKKPSLTPFIDSATSGDSPGLHKLEAPAPVVGERFFSCSCLS